ncbi:MAG: DUF4129 domain-containing protein [Gemmatimonadota bacterium]|jgi:hypothetical protein
MLLQAVPPGAGPITAARVHAALARILARPEYAPAQPPLLYRWLRAASHWVWALLSGVVHWLFPDVHLDPSTWSTLARVVSTVGMLLGLALIVYLLWLAVQALRRRRRRRRSEEAAPAAPPSAEDWEALARAAATREDWRAAAMALYQAVLLRLSGAGVLTLDGAKTPGDYRRDLGHDGTLAARFDAFLRGFERVAYGAASPGPDHYGRLTASAAMLGSDA